MKRDCGKRRYTRSIVNVVRFWLVLVVLISSSGPMLVSADDDWSDNFDDGDYDGWTVYFDNETTTNGTFSAANGYLECTGLEQPYNRSIIYHESNVSTGTWSFDCYLPNEDNEYLGAMLRGTADFVGCLFIQITSIRVVLWLNRSLTPTNWGWAMVAYWRSTYNGTWTHIDVTLNEDLLFDVFVNNVHRISYTNSSPIWLASENRYSWFGAGTIGEAIDNVVVKDEVDTSLPFNTTPTTTTPSDTTTTSTTLTDGGLDMTMILLIGGGVAAIVVIVLIVWKFRGKT